MNNERPFNNLLQALRQTDYELIGPRLELNQRPASELLYNPGDNVETVYFPCGASLVSLLVSSEDGRDVETILIGREGAVGGIVSSGTPSRLLPDHRQEQRKIRRLRVDHLEAAKAKSPTLHNLFARYADCLLAQVFQSTACNAIYSIEQRAAKWIIAAMERTGDFLVPLTQEEFAGMLGVGRSYTSRVMQGLKAEKIIEIQRGSLLVLQFGGVESPLVLMQRERQKTF